MEIKTLKGVNSTDILEVFNLSFSDYSIPFKLSLEQLNSKILADKTDLNLSVGVFENDKLIAFILHGVDIIDYEKVVYNGGTGVIPSKRGSGLTKQMYQFIFPILKANEVRKLQLEVIKGNTPAIQSYLKSGYKIERTLLCYNGEVVVNDETTSITVKKINAYDWDKMESFWDIYPAWQNSKNVLSETILNTISIGAFFENELVGYLIYKGTRIQQIAVSENFRRQKIATILIREMIKVEGTSISIINVDESSESLHTFLEGIGLKNDLTQLEMTRLI